MPRLTSRFIALFATAAFIVGCPDDDTVPTTALPGGLDLSGLNAEQRRFVRATLEISGGALVETELVLSDDRTAMSGAFDVQNVEESVERNLTLRVYGRFAETSGEVLLGRLIKPITLQPEVDVAVTFAAADVFDTCGGEPGACAVLFDANRNGASNIEDLLERTRSNGRGIDPAPQPPYLVTSSEQLQFPSGVRLGSFARQLVVLENFGENPVTIKDAAVVGGQGFSISILDPTGQSVAPPGRSLAGDAFRAIAAGQEAFVGVSFTPVNGFVTTGALFVRVQDQVTLVEQTARVKLIANPEGELRPADPVYIEPDLDSVSIDGGALPVVAFPNAQLQSGDALIAEDALGAGLRQSGATLALVDGAQAVAFPADAAFAVDIAAGQRFSTAIDGLTSDIDIAVVNVNADGGIGGLACETCRSANAGTSPEAVGFKNDDAARRVVVLLGRIEPERDAPENEGALTVAETVSFRCSTTVSAGPEFAEIDPIAPTTGPLEGGIPVVLRGSGFDPRARVSVGGAEALDVSITTGDDGVDTVSFTLPAAVGAELPASVIVENPADGGDGQAATLLEAFTYQPPAPVIDELRPDVAPTTGGTTPMTIIGRFFSARHGPPQVAFGAVTVDATFISASQIAVTPPPHIDAATAATVSVKVRNRLASADGAVTLGSASNGVAFRYLVPSGAAPTITAVSPATGSVDGGTRVTLTGTDLRAGLLVFFGARPATCDSPSSSTTVSCLTPAADAPSAVDLIVVNADGQSAKLNAAFAYEIPSPTITSVFPARGISDGGTFLVVEGGGFRPGARVTFTQGATVRAATAATRVSGTTMLVTTPAGTAGTATLTITNLDAQTVTAPFTYFAPDQATPPPSITALSPAVGDASGGFPVVISGSGFLDPGVLFGSSAVQVVSFIDRDPPALDEVTVIAPPSPTGVAAAVTVQVLNDDGQAATNGFNYTFSAAAPPRIDRITPSTFVSGTTNAFTIAGARFDAGAAVLVAGLQATVNTRSSTSISATIAGQLPLGAVQVVVENPNGQAVSIPVQVVSATGAVQPAITALSITDVHARVAGDVVTLFGVGLDAGPATVRVTAASQADPELVARVLVQSTNFLVVELPAIPPGQRVLQATFETPTGTRTALTPPVRALDPVVIFDEVDQREDGLVEFSLFGDFFNPGALTSIVLESAAPLACAIEVATERALRCRTSEPMVSGLIYEVTLSWTGRDQAVLQRTARELGVQRGLVVDALEIVDASARVRGLTDFSVVNQTITLTIPGIDPALIPIGSRIDVVYGNRFDRGESSQFLARGVGVLGEGSVTVTLTEGQLDLFGTQSLPVAVVIDDEVELAFGFIEGEPRFVQFNSVVQSWAQPVFGALQGALPGDVDRVTAVRAAALDLVVPMASTLVDKSLTLTDTRALAPGQWLGCLNDQDGALCTNTGNSSFTILGLTEEEGDNDLASTANGINASGSVSGVVSNIDPDHFFFRLDADQTAFNLGIQGGCTAGMSVAVTRRSGGAAIADACLDPTPLNLTADEYVVAVTSSSSEPSFYTLVLGDGGGGVEPGFFCGDNIVNGAEACDEGGISQNGCSFDCQEFDEVNDEAGVQLGFAPTSPQNRTLSAFDVDRFAFVVEAGGTFRVTLQNRVSQGCSGSIDTASLQGGPSGFIPLFPDTLGCVDNTVFLESGTYLFTAQAASIPLKYTFQVQGGGGEVGGACGNGLVESGEFCDDGNFNNGDGCSAVCTIEPGFSCEGQPSLCAPSLCGNGVLDPGESCDEGSLNGQVVAFGSFSNSPQVLCDATCNEPITLDMDVGPPAFNVGRTLTVGDIEFIGVNVATRSELNIFTTFRTGAFNDGTNCANRITLTIFDLQQGRSLITSVDGGGGCAFAQVVVPAGRYFAQVEATDPNDSFGFTVGAFLEAAPAGDVCGDTIERSGPVGVVERVTRLSGLAIFGGLGAGVAVDTNDVIYAVQNPGTGHSIRRIAPNNATATIASGQFSGGADLEVGPDGFLYLADGVGLGSNAALSGDVVRRISPTSGATTVFISGVANPTGLAFGPDGLLYVAEFDARRISRFSAFNGALVDVFVTGLPLRPTDLEFGPDGHLYVAGFNAIDTSPQQSVFSINPSRVVSTFFTHTGNADPHSLAFDKGGNLWVSMYNGGELVRVSPDGVVSVPLGNEPSPPNGIAIGRDSALYVLLNNGNVDRIRNAADIGKEQCDNGVNANGGGCSPGCRDEGDVVLGVGLDTVQRGGGGGQPFRDICDVGSVLVGVSGRAGVLLSSLGAICARTQFDGATVNLVDRYGLPLRGLGPVDAESRCPAGSAVTGFSGNAGQLVDALEFACAPLTNDGGVTVGAPVANAPRIGGTGGVAFVETACPAGQIARGIRVNIGADVDAFGLVCGTL